MEDPFDAAIAELLRGREQVIERAMEFEQQGMAAEDQLGLLQRFHERELNAMAAQFEAQEEENTSLREENARLKERLRILHRYCNQTRAAQATAAQSSPAPDPPRGHTNFSPRPEVRPEQPAETEGQVSSSRRQPGMEAGPSPHFLEQEDTGTDAQARQFLARGDPRFADQPRGQAARDSAAGPSATTHKFKLQRTNGAAGKVQYRKKSPHPRDGGASSGASTSSGEQHGGEVPQVGPQEANDESRDMDLMPSRSDLAMGCAAAPQAQDTAAPAAGAERKADPEADPDPVSEPVPEPEPEPEPRLGQKAATEAELQGDTRFSDTQESPVLGPSAESHGGRRAYRPRASKDRLVAAAIQDDLRKQEVQEMALASFDPNEPQSASKTRKRQTPWKGEDADSGARGHRQQNEEEEEGQGWDEGFEGGRSMAVDKADQRGDSGWRQRHQTSPAPQLQHRRWQKRGGVENKEPQSTRDHGTATYGSKGSNKSPGGTTSAVAGSRARPQAHQDRDRDRGRAQPLPKQRKRQRADASMGADDQGGGFANDNQGHSMKGAAEDVEDGGDDTDGSLSPELVGGGSMGSRSNPTPSKFPSKSPRSSGAAKGSANRGRRPAAPPSGASSLASEDEEDGGGGGVGGSGAPRSHGKQQAKQQNSKRRRVLATEDQASGNALDGKTFVITGVLPSLEREQAEDLIKSHGGRVTSAVSGKTSFLLAGSNLEDGRDADQSSKYKAAVEKQTKILDEDQLYALIRGKQAAVSHRDSRGDRERQGRSEFSRGAQHHSSHRKSHHTSTSSSTHWGHDDLRDDVRDDDRRPGRSDDRRDDRHSRSDKRPSALSSKTSSKPNPKPGASPRTKTTASSSSSHADRTRTLDQRGGEEGNKRARTSRNPATSSRANLPTTHANGEAGGAGFDSRDHRQSRGTERGRGSVAGLKSGASGSMKEAASRAAGKAGKGGDSKDDRDGEPEIPVVTVHMPGAAGRARKGGDSKDGRNGERVIPMATVHMPGAFAYREVVRKKCDRENLPGHSCDRCQGYLDAVMASGALNPTDKDLFMGDCSRHKDWHPPALTPDGFWELSFKDSLETRD